MTITRKPMSGIENLIQDQKEDIKNLENNLKKLESTWFKTQSAQDQIEFISELIQSRKEFLDKKEVKEK